METTFKEQTHAELLTRLPKNSDEITAFLSALATTCGTLEMSRKQRFLSFSLGTYDECAAVRDLIKQLYPADLTMKETKMRIMGVYKTCYNVVIPAGFSKQALIDFGIMYENEIGLLGLSRGIPWQILHDDACYKAYFKGLYMACGSVYIPSLRDDGGKSNGYHFELQLSDEDEASGVKEFLSDMRINAKESERGGSYILYVKDRDEIMNALSLLELSEACAKMRDVINERDIANVLNRSVICETANLDKTMEASSRILVAIGRLKDSGAFDDLPDNLKETATMRAKYPEDSMQSLSEKLKVSKSCLHHRLQKIENLANGASEN